MYIMSSSHCTGPSTILTHSAGMQISREGVDVLPPSATVPLGMQQCQYYYYNWQTFAKVVGKLKMHV